jgi:PAS domain S-box-containing protein
VTSYPSDSFWPDVFARLARDPGLSPFLKEGSAALLLGQGGEALTGNPPGLAMAALGFSAPAALRLALLAEKLAPVSGIRLERLELQTREGPVAVTCALRRVKSEGGPALLVIAPDFGALALASPARFTAPGSVSEASEPRSPEPASGPAAPLPSKLRFLWELTGQGRISSFSPEAVQAFGQPMADAMLGRHWSALCGEYVHDPEGGVAAALESGRTWSGKPSLWRIEGGDQAYRVTLSGLPIAGPDRALLGWRGFGIVHTAETAAFPAAGAASPAAKQPSADQIHARSEPIPAQEKAAPAEADGAEADRAEATQAAQEDGVAGARQADGAEPAKIVGADSGPVEMKAAPPPASRREPQHAPRSNVVPIRPADGLERLSSSERNAFREIAKALGARIEGEDAPASADEAATPATPGDVASGNDETAAVESDSKELQLSEPEALEPEAAEPEAPQADPAEVAAPDPVVAEAEDAPPAEAEAAPDEPEPELSLADAEPSAPAPDPSLLPAELVARAAALAPPAPASGDAFAALLDKLPIGVLALQAERIVYANATLVDLLGHDDLASLAAVGADALFRGRAPSEGGGAISLLRADGGLEPVDARLSAILWRGAPATLMSFRRALENGEAARLEALKLDVAKAQGQARELSAILDTATDGVATLDERGRILSLNRSAEALFGYDQREVTGENFTLMLAPESHITALDYLEGLKGGGVAALLNDGREVQGRVRQGGRIPLYMTMGRVAEGTERKYSAVLRDMTAWKRAEADLVEARRAAEQASAQKSDVLAKISHEIRTPLNAILGFTEVMSEERFGPIGNERYKEYLTDIHQSGGYLISLINDLLDLAKIEAGKMDLTFVGVNLNEVAGAAVALLQPEANRQRVVLRTGLQPKLPSVVADERSLRQIVINILSNAVKFTDAGGQVILSTALGDRGEVILRVRDTGIGMTEKELGQAMEPFRQVASTRRANSTGTGGTGLGLPITKALVEANKGAIQITSAKNEGTLVEITFPPQRVLAS